MDGIKKTSRIGLEELRARMSLVASPAFRRTMSRGLGEEARTQVANGFRDQRDPYGKAWEPLRYRRGKILQDTGRLRASCAVRSNETGFRIYMTARYAAPHQYGARPHARKGGSLALSKRGRIISKLKAGRTKATAQRVALFGAYTHGGIPQRQMIPMTSTGGLGPIWTVAFNKHAMQLIDSHARGRA